LIHVGISVLDMDSSIEWWAGMGYTKTFDVFRDEPFLGKIVGLPGAQARIVYLECEGRPTLELLHYTSPEYIDRIQWGATIPGRAHLCLDFREGDKIPEGSMIGSATIPDGKNAGCVCAYFKDPNGFVLEVAHLERNDG
jgi:catechol 2,3-dioxygenase-like lactoylglutathione lyase family enzyme